MGVLRLVRGEETGLVEVVTMEVSGRGVCEDSGRGECRQVWVGPKKMRGF